MQCTKLNCKKLTKTSHKLFWEGNGKEVHKSSQINLRISQATHKQKKRDGDFPRKLFYCSALFLSKRLGK